MKNLLLKLTILIIALMFSACGSKAPFKEEKPIQNAALVYLYVPTSLGVQDDHSTPRYKISINNKNLEGYITDKEYKAFQMKPNPTIFSVTRNQIIEKKVKLDLQAGETYYLRVMSDLAGGEFEFIQVNKKVGSEEIVLTDLSGSKVIDVKTKITEFMSSDTKEEASPIISKEAEPAKVVPQKAVVVEKETMPAISKTDEVRKAFNLKKDGILTEAEYEKLKAEILAK